jgi:hypothetical protein
MPNDKRLCFVKEEVLGITNGRPIIGVDHPVMMEIWVKPIAGALCIFLFCDDQYTTTLERLQETNNEDFKNYMTSNTQGWVRRWGCAGTSVAAASPAPPPPPAQPRAEQPPAAGCVGGCTAATTPARESSRTTRVLHSSSRLTRRGAQPTTIGGCSRPRLWRSCHLRARLRTLLASAKLACARGNTHIEIIYPKLCDLTSHIYNPFQNPIENDALSAK